MLNWPQVLALPCHPGVDLVLLLALFVPLVVLLLLLFHLVQLLRNPLCGLPVLGGDDQVRLGSLKLLFE